MNCNETLKLLQAHKQELAMRYGVTTLALFGSTVRNTAGPDSDVDILVAFDGPATSAILVFSFIWRIYWAILSIW